MIFFQSVDRSITKLLNRLNIFKMGKFIKNEIGIICMVLAFISISCSGIKNDNTTYDEKRPGQFFIVDTIFISDPVRIYSSKFGGQFIISRDVLSNFKNNADFFERNDVFLLGEDLYRDLPLEKFKNYLYPDYGGCQFVESTTTIPGLEVYEFKEPKPFSFLLGMINAKYFNSKHNSYSSFKSFKDMSAYYKIVYPICERAGEK